MLPKASCIKQYWGSQRTRLFLPLEGLAGSVSMLWKWIPLECNECFWLKQHPSSASPGKYPKLQNHKLVLDRCLGAVVVGRPVAKWGGAVISWLEHDVQSCSGHRWSDPSDCSGARGAWLGVSTCMLFLSKNMAGGALLKEGKARLLAHREGPSSPRSFTQTHCQNWEPSPLLLPRADGEKGMAANPTALQVSSLSQYNSLLLAKVFIFHAEQVLSAKIPPVVKRSGVSKSSKCP